MTAIMKTFLLGLVFAAGVAGCNTMEGVGEDVEATGEAIDEQAEKNR